VCHSSSVACALVDYVIELTLTPYSGLAKQPSARECFRQFGETISLRELERQLLLSRSGGWCTLTLKRVGCFWAAVRHTVVVSAIG
jgi:hypothetical protein